MKLKHPDVMNGSSNKYQSWEVCDPEKWVPNGYICVRVELRGCGRSPGYVEHSSPRETKDFANCFKWAEKRAAMVKRQGRVERHLLLRNQSMAGREHAAEAPCRHLRVGRLRRFLSCSSATTAGSIVRLTDVLDMQVKTVQYGLGTRGHRSRMNGDWVSGPETLTEEAIGADRYDLGKTYCGRIRSGRTNCTRRCCRTGRRSRCRCSRPRIRAGSRCTRAVISKDFSDRRRNRNGWSARY